MKYSIYTIILIILVGCNTSPKRIYERYSGFPETTYLEGTLVPLDTALFHFPFRIVVKNNIALIHDLHNADYYLHAFSFPEGKHIVSFIPRGEGPEEMVICETFQFVSVDSIWALDPDKLLIHRYQLSPEEKRVSLVEKIPLDKDLLRSLDLNVTSSGFIVPDYTGHHRYHVVDWEGNITRSGGFLPKETPGKETVAFAQGWRPFMHYNEENDYLAVVTQLGEVMELYTLTDTVHIVKYGPQGEPEFKESGGNGHPTGIMGFWDVQVTDKYVYAIFDGISFEEIGRQLQQNMNPPQGGNLIYVFDLEGNPVKKFELDYQIAGFDVHEEEKIIYAVDINQDDPIIKFAF